MEPWNCFCNILWLIFFVWEPAFLWTLLGVLWCCIIIGIPFGVQAIKLGCLILWPFGKEVVEKEGGADGCDCCLNIIWFFFWGFALFILSLIEGLLCCCTIVGIPCGLQLFKFAKLALTPFGRRIVDSGTVIPNGPIVVVQPTVVVAPQQPQYVPPVQYAPPITAQPIYP